MTKFLLAAAGIALSTNAALAADDWCSAIFSRDVNRETCNRLFIGLSGASCKAPARCGISPREGAEVACGILGILRANESKHRDELADWQRCVEAFPWIPGSEGGAAKPGAPLPFPVPLLDPKFAPDPEEIRSGRLAPTTPTPSAHERGLAALNKGDLDTAIAEFTTAIANDPKNPFSYIRRGTAYEKKGDAASAIGDYRNVLKLVDAETGAEYAAKIRKLEKTKK